MIPLGILASSRRVSADYSAAVLADTPALYWRLGESSGTTAADASGNSRPGTYGGSGITLGASGLTSDGDLCPTFADVTALKVSRASESWMETYPLTIECLFRQTATVASAEHTIIARHGSNVAWDVLVVDGQLRARVRPAGTFFTLAPAPAVSLDTTYHLAFVIGTSASTLFLNGVSVASHATSSATGPGTALTVGTKQIATHGPFIGKIDEVALYGSALSADRILAHAQAAGVA